MRVYEIKRGHWKNIEGDQLPALLQDIFGSAKRVADGTYETSFRALTRLTVKYANKTQIDVDTVMDGKASNEDARATIKAYNVFLERVTGLSAKERAKRAKKTAEKDAPNA